MRGTPHNTGVPLKRMLEAGAQPIGDSRECHAIAVDARAPSSMAASSPGSTASFGIVVNALGQRFYDEGEDMWPKRYAIWGKLIARQPGQIAYSIVDAKSANAFMPSVFPPVATASIPELAARLDSSCWRSRSDHRRLQLRRASPHARPGCARLSHRGPQSGQDPLGSAARRATLWAYPLRPGITFTYLGLKVDERTRVLMSDGRPAANVCAAGEVMAETSC